MFFSFWSGLWGGIDTLVSQAYGRKDYRLCGVYLNTARFVIIVANLIQLIVWLNIKSIFLMIGQPPESAEIGSFYIISILPGLFMNMQFEWLRRFLLVQGIYNPIMYILASTLWLHITLLYIFIIVLKYQIGGIAIATATTYSLNFILLTGYVHFNKNLINRDSWHWFDINCILKLSNYLKYAIPAWLMSTIEMWAFEILIIFSGFWGIKQLAALTIMLSVNTIIFMFALGISFSSTSLVGNNLGANKPIKAKTYSRAALTFWFMFFLPIIICQMEKHKSCIKFIIKLVNNYNGNLNYFTNYLHGEYRSVLYKWWRDHRANLILQSCMGTRNYWRYD